MTIREGSSYASGRSATPPSGIVLNGRPACAQALPVRAALWVRRPGPVRARKWSVPCREQGDDVLPVTRSDSCPDSARAEVRVAGTIYSRWDLCEGVCPRISDSCVDEESGSRTTITAVKRREGHEGVTPRAYERGASAAQNHRRTARPIPGAVPTSVSRETVHLRRLRVQLAEA